MKLKTVLVTGGCGFLGSHICEKFKENDWNVISIDNLTKYELSKTGYNVTEARDHNLNFLKSIGVENYKIDIRNLEQLEDKCQGVDYIVHTAAQPAMTLSLEDPLYDMSVNIIGSFNILKIATKLNIPCALCSTIHVYGNEINSVLRETKSRYEPNQEYFLNESAPILKGDLTPLHISKGSADLYAQAFINSYNSQIGVFRLTGLYGPRQFGGEDHGWVANFAIRTLTNQSINIYGTGKQVRDILYVKDAANAFYQYFYNPIPGVYNLSGGIKCSTSLLECVSILEDQTKENVKINYSKGREGDLLYFVDESKKFREKYNWEPCILPEIGIQKLSDWILTNKNIFTSYA